MERTRATPGEVVGIVAGAALFVGSFLPFYEGGLVGGTAPAIGGGSATVSWSAWSNAWHLFPILPAVVLMGMSVGVRVGLTRLGVITRTSRLGRTARYDLVLTTAGAAVVLAYVARDLLPITTSNGAWTVLLSAAAVATGAFLRALESGS
jgi:hypothetical protein